MEGDVVWQMVVKTCLEAVSTEQALLVIQACLVRVCLSIMDIPNILVAKD